MDAGESEELQRLRRELRAQSAVNRQQHAQLEAGAIRGVQRLTPGSEWLEHLQLHRGGDPTLVHAPTKGGYVVEGNIRRQVKAGMLFNALVGILGPPREIRDDELERWSEGPPVEVMESGSGPAFLVIGGRRLPLRGLPLSYFVTADQMLLFPEGEEINLNTARAVSRGKIARARTLIDRDGAVRGAAKLVRKAVRRARRPRSRES